MSEDIKFCPECGHNFSKSDHTLENSQEEMASQNSVNTLRLDAVRGSPISSELGASRGHSSNKNDSPLMDILSIIGGCIILYLIFGSILGL